MSRVSRAMAEWTADQRKYMEWLATPRMIRTPPTVEMIAEEIGVDRVNLWRWTKLPGWDEEVKILIRASLGKKLPDLYGALIREAEQGSFPHLRMALEMVGEYTPTQHNRNESSGEVKLIVETQGLSSVPEHLSSKPVNSDPGTEAI
jgi:hypothetical protein